MSERPGSWMRDHLANERTLMAWGRTSLALVAVGLGVAKIANFLQIAAVDHPELANTLPAPFWSKLIALSLVGVGGFAMVSGVVRTRRWAAEVGGEPPAMMELWVMSGVFLAISAAIGLYIAVG
jgi:putative membrane protein